MSLILRPYKAASKSGKVLADALGIKRMAMEGSKWKNGPNKYVINWGANEIPNLPPGTVVMNRPDKVAIATDKLAFFQKMYGEVNLPMFFTNINDAAQHMQETGRSVVCRTMLRANSGRGIVIADKVEDLVDAPLYTLYIKKKFEYRVHVAFGNVISIQQKARKVDVPDDQVNWRVRNHDNGFIFKREGVELGAEPRSMSRKVVDNMGLNFGAVDLIYNEKQDSYYVLEVNTAPGLEGQTLEDYVDAFQQYV